MVIRTITEMKVFDIIAESASYNGMGCSFDYKKIIYHEGIPYESFEECNKLLAKAVEDWEEKMAKNPHVTTPNKPRLKIYWKEISKTY